MKHFNDHEDRAAKRERGRITEITAIGKRFQVEDQAQRAIENGMSSDAFKGVALRAIDERAQPPVDPAAPRSDAEIRFAMDGARMGKGPDGDFHSMGEFFRSVAIAGMPDGQTDKRLLRAASGLNETVSSEGGFLVQQGFSDQLLKGAFETGILAQRCNRIPMSSGTNGTKLPAINETDRATGSRWGGIRGYWLSEADQKQASKPKFRELNVNLKKHVCLVYTTDELLEDVSLLESVLTQGCQEEIGFGIDTAIVSGSGAGQPLGILNSGSLVTVPKETGQAAATIMYENILKMWSRSLPRARRNAVWLINQDVEPQLYSMVLSVGVGGSPVFMPSGGASAAPYASLFGCSVIPIEQAETLGTTGDIILADLSYYLLIDKGGIQKDRSIHVRFIYDESVFRFVYRVDGQPIFASPITPFKGTGTVSPFVALETRS